MSFDELLEQQRTALLEGDTAQALVLLKTIAKWRTKARLWAELKQSQPESYEQLIGKLRAAAEGHLPSGRTVLSQLAKVFGRCSELGIELSALGIPDNLHKYREAAAKLNDIIDSGAGDEETERQLRATIAIIRSDANRAQTRKWARTPRMPG